MNCTLFQCMCVTNLCISVPALHKHGDDGFGERDGNGGPGVVIRHLCSGSSWNRNMFYFMFYLTTHSTHF